MTIIHQQTTISAITGYGATNIALPATSSPNDDGVWPGTVSAGIRLARDGVFSRMEHGSYFAAGAAYWIATADRTATIGDSYEAMCTQLTGDTPSVGSDATGSWLTINGDIEWFYSTGGKGVTLDGTFEVQVRRIAQPLDITNVMAVTIHVFNFF